MPFLWSKRICECFSAEVLAEVNSDDVFEGGVSEPALSDWEGTHYTPGLGACETVNRADEMVAALNKPQFGTFPRAMNSPWCQQCVLAKYQEKSVKVRIVDLCPSCSYGDLDLSPAAFSQLAELGVGRIKISWQKVDC